MLGLCPILLNVALVVRLLGSWWWMPPLLLLAVFTMPGRHWRARLDHHLLLDGGLMAGRWPMRPGPGFWKGQWFHFYGAIIIITILALLPSSLVSWFDKSAPSAGSVSVAGPDRFAQSKSAFKKMQEAQAGASTRPQENVDAGGDQGEATGEQMSAGDPKGRLGVARPWNSSRWLERRPGRIGY